MRTIIRAGTNVLEPLTEPVTSYEMIQKLLGLGIELETVRLRQFRELHYMVCDEIAYMRKVQPPVNSGATRLYWANCIPGTTHLILGDVIVFPASDFPEDDEGHYE